MKAKARSSAIFFLWVALMLVVAAAANEQAVMSVASRLGW